MSQPSPTTEHPSVTTPATAGTQNPVSQTSGASAESSRPGTASAPKTEAYGGYGGFAPGRLVTEVGGGASSRRQSAESTAQTPSRALGVHSILNPPADPEERELPHVRLLGQPAMSITQSLLPAPAESPRSRKRTDPRSPIQTREQDQPASARLGRRVLTPKSPAVRATSLGARRNPTFHSTIQPLQPLPGPAGRTYTAEPGPYRTSEIPPLPSLAVATGSNLPNLAPLETGGQPRSAHVPESPARGLEPILPQSDRPSTSQTAYAKLEQPSPSYRYGLGRTPSQPQPPGTFRVLPAAGPGGFGQEHQAHGPHEGYQAGQASYQMTLDTDQGPMVVPVELDLQQASKVADEKRKRNAGASARFRARRKEKEKEASQTISGLQQELRDLIEERDYYLAERNYFREMATRHVPPGQLLPRPPSPQQRRLAAAAAAAAAATTTTGGSSENPPALDESYRDLPESSTAQRRRTGDYQPTFIGRQAHSPPTSAYGAGFPSQPPLPLPPPAGSSQFGTPRTLPPGPPPPSITRSQSYDPFRRDPFDRSWSSGR
ncbi:uncharacterized protein Z518_10639 [Rhinocladiella mackenziei CBS 650.93]|uniref:BZIP domain-containing protein n=1 Tax=Rhinocladiella mackenziei CBS 650.93 TaxID=1442369 RepID=A0A0D2I438_9EURO|nr:uncharacterized protein Z518_10639 [Rhinocladiella mackenziei CBS 650.93]KIX00499.1 hypothetical protein Z518_10639 [Rhinocladiella mackenziei CBS 650.93]